MIELYSSAIEHHEYISFITLKIYFIVIAANPDDKVKLSFAASIRSREMLIRLLSRQVTAKKVSLTASHFPEVSMYKHEGEMKWKFPKAHIANVERRERKEVE